jgi:hypothetical protein
MISGGGMLSGRVCVSGLLGVTNVGDRMDSSRGAPFGDGDSKAGETVRLGDSALGFLPLIGDTKSGAANPSGHS